MFNGYDALLGRSFRRDVVEYIGKCHLEDGGYFFARVPPSGGTDTYFAVKSLSILGVKPDRPEDIASFFLGRMNEVWLNNITGLFAASEVLGELGLASDDFRHLALRRLESFRNRAGGFGATENIDVEVPSELRDTCRAVQVLGLFGGSLDKEKVTRFVLGLLNQDGGYGRDGHSTLASTFYATTIHKILGTDIGKLTRTRDYLRKIEENWQVQFLEDLYWLIFGLTNLGEKLHMPARAVGFVMECQRPGGGFSRATVMGIPTLEYTYYSLSVLKDVEAL